MRFVKMHGLGNDFVLVDCLSQQVPEPAEVARLVSDRHRGIGADGLILILRSSQADLRMKMYNADGSKGLVCGNGLRCVGKYAYEHGLCPHTPIGIETDMGVTRLQLAVRGGIVSGIRVDMGQPSLDPVSLPAQVDGQRIVNRILEFGSRQFEVTCVSMGNPHAVIYADERDQINLHAIGPLIENASIFPDRINVHFVNVLTSGRVSMRTWERGSGATQACGSGACAVCVAGVVTERTGRSVIACLPGGELEIEWGSDDHVYMTGPAVEVFAGEWNSEARTPQTQVSNRLRGC